jgi:polyisoprenoid-binding protein YceI
MATWILEPGHTEAEFRARHMMVTWVRGLFKDIHGRLELDFDRCEEATFHGVIDATAIWTGEPDRDAHLRSADFFDVENHPQITFAGRFTDRTGATTFKGDVDLTIRGVTRTVPLEIVSLGEWRTPF